MYRMPYNEAWSRSVDWFADHNVLIDKIEKDSGLLTARFKIEVGDEYLDCGVIKVSGLARPAEITRSGYLNVTVRDVSNGQSKVSVNFFGEWDLEGIDLWEARPVNANGECRSTGKLEGAILEFVGR